MIARWVELWSRREPATSLACVRIGIAAVLLVDLLAAWWLGALPALWTPPPSGFGWGALSEHPPVLVQWFGAREGVAIAAWLLAVLSAIGVAFGFCFRVTSWLLVFAMLELEGLMPDGDGIDGLVRIVLPLLALSDAHAVLSFDARWKRGRGKPLDTEILAWPRYLIVVQLLWVYFSAAHHRGKASWGFSGEFAALGDVLGDPHFSRFAPGAFAPLYPLLQLAGFLTMVFEFSAPLFLLFSYYQRRPDRGGFIGAWVRRLRLRDVWLALGVGLHLGIAATMELGIFPFGILALYPALLPPDELEALHARARQLIDQYKASTRPTTNLR
ncbi:MAG TPA: HTTM domain-containing protein [Polyangiaceae bacterium]|nr:HTTM domain-containing protein [Polyangiaceae bacterium]